MKQEISGRVLANYKKGKDKNWLFIGTTQFGRMIVKAVLQDKEADSISMNDYVQISGKPRRRVRTLPDGSTVEEILLTKPVVERRIRSYRSVNKVPAERLQ